MASLAAAAVEEEGLNGASGGHQDFVTSMRRALHEIMKIEKAKTKKNVPMLKTIKGMQDRVDEYDRTEKKLAGFPVRIEAATDVDDFDEVDSLQLQVERIEEQQAAARLEWAKEWKGAAMLVMRCGFSVEEFKQAGFSLEELRQVGFSAKELTQEGLFTLRELKEAGFSAKEVNGFTLGELKQAGFSLKELKQITWTPVSPSRTQSPRRAQTPTSPLSPPGERGQ